MAANEVTPQSIDELVRPLPPALRAVAAAALSQLGNAGDVEALQPWFDAGRGLSEVDVDAARAYFEASAALTALSAAELVEWSTLGRRLYRKTPKSLALVARFFTLTPSLLASLDFASLRQLGAVLDGLGGHSVDHATACLNAVPALCAALDAAGLTAFLEFAAAIVETAWMDAVPLFQRSPELLMGIEPFQRAPYLQLSAQVARRPKTHAFRLYVDGARSLKDVRNAYQGRIVELATRLLAFSSLAPMAFVKNAAYLSSRLEIDELEAWYNAGVETFLETGSGGDAYFSLELRRAEEMIGVVSARVDLVQVAPVLSLYMKALVGTSVAIVPVDSLAERGIGWISDAGASTEGSSVFLPGHVEDFATKAENFAAFKVYATYQVAHLEFGSFSFDFDAEGSLLPRRRGAIEKEQRAAGELSTAPTLTAMERFFDLFADRQLAADIFALVEDARIDARIDAEYVGLRGIGRRLKDLELSRRPNTYFLALRQAFVENLLRASLGGLPSAGWPLPLAPLLKRAIEVLLQMREPGASVEDAAEATVLLYEAAMRVPNLPAGEGGYIDQFSIAELEEESSLKRDPLEGISGREVPYESVAGVGYHGDFKPEMVQLLMKLRGEDGNDPPSAEQIKAALAKSVELDQNRDLETLVQNLQQDVEETQASAEEIIAQASIMRPANGARTFHYNEWDFRAGDYRPRWCTLVERTADEGDSSFFGRVLEEHADLVKETQRNFEMMKPQPFLKIKRLEDGEEFDLDAAIEFVAQKKAGSGENAKVYWRRNKVEREVAVAFLVDMSSSTDARVEKNHWPPKRIIDLEKESLVLLAGAVEVIGDRYGVFGFSGTTRHNVDFVTIKGFDEHLTDAVRRRIDGVRPVDSTRMGAAIRHATAKLLAVEARTRILFLVSDGRPQDVDYGAEPGDREYAIRDTHKAFLEAKQRGITPFALTVDKEGNEYLGQMCGDMAYEVLSDIELLPSRLPALYRMLTE